MTTALARRQVVLERRQQEVDLGAEFSSDDPPRRFVACRPHRSRSC